jgi:8-oxo-dGTP diphosphatase
MSMPDNLPRVGSALIVRDEANRILLGKRNKDPQRGSWVLPGGKIHAFESIAAAAARELEEETGLEVEVEHHFGVYEIINPPDEHRIVIYSWERVISGTPKASDDLAELRFASLDELGDLPTTPLVRKVLADAGFLLREIAQVQKPATQLNLSFFAIPVAGAQRAQHPSRTYARQKPKTHGSPQISPLLFDQALLQ